MGLLVWMGEGYPCCMILLWIKNWKEKKKEQEIIIMNKMRIGV